MQKGYHEQKNAWSFHRRSCHRHHPPPPPPPPPPLILFLLIFTFLFFKNVILLIYLKLMPNSNSSVARFENETTLWKNEAKPLKNGILRDNSTNKQVQCADPSHDKWMTFHVFPILYVAPTSKNGRL